MAYNTFLKFFRLESEQRQLAISQPAIEIKYTTRQLNRQSQTDRQETMTNGIDTFAITKAI